MYANDILAGENTCASCNLPMLCYVILKMIKQMLYGKAQKEVLDEPVSTLAALLTNTSSVLSFHCNSRNEHYKRDILNI